MVDLGAMDQHRAQDMQQQDPAGGYALALASSAGAGLATVIGKWNLTAMAPLAMNALIFVVASFALSVWLLPRHRFSHLFVHSRQGWFWIAMFALSSWFAIWAFWSGVQKIDPALAGFLNRAEVIVAIALAILFLRERFTKLEMLGAVLSIGGIVAMRVTLRVEYTEGFWLVLIGALFFGITEFVSKIAVRYVTPVILAYIRNMFLAVMYWLVVYAAGISFDGVQEVWPGVLALGIAGPILSRMIYLLALKRLALSRVAVISQSQPIFVMILTLLVFGQLPTFRELVGGFFIVLGCVLMLYARHLQIYRDRRALRRNSN